MAKATGSRLRAQGANKEDTFMLILDVECKEYLRMLLQKTREDTTSPLPHIAIQSALDKAELP